MHAHDAAVGSCREQGRIWGLRRARYHTPCKLCSVRAHGLGMQASEHMSLLLGSVLKHRRPSCVPLAFLQCACTLASQPERSGAHAKNILPWTFEHSDTKTNVATQNDTTITTTTVAIFTTIATSAPPPSCRT